MEKKNRGENPLMKDPAYRRLVGERNKLVKQINFIEQRIEKYAYAMSDKDIFQLRQRMDETTGRLADVNDRLADIEEGINNPPPGEHWTGHASRELMQASRKAAS